jgi:hypothetical protein
MDETPITPGEAVANLINTVTVLRHTRTVATVTPDMATRLLNTVDLDISRRLNGATVEHLALAMRDGKFFHQANLLDPLTITEDGRLRNGKQRLIALLLTGTTCTFTFELHTHPER